MLVKEYPNLDRADERVAADVMLAYSFGDAARAQGWGTMDPAIWQEQIALYSELGQFTAAHAEGRRGHHARHPQGDAGRAPDGLTR